MKIGIPKETLVHETRVAISPSVIKKLRKKNFTVLVEKGAGDKAGFSDEEFHREGAELVDRERTLSSHIIFKIHCPKEEDISKMQKGALLLGLMDPHKNRHFIEKLASQNIHTIAMEFVPRTSRAQSMDVLSSQANIAGYRAVLEAFQHYPRFAPMMMTSAGMAKPCRLAVLGVGVAGLQAIATARRLGCNVEAYDVRPEVKEQILSLGAKCIEVHVEESATGEGGYAKELSQATQKKLQDQLQEKLKNFDVIITTANIPGKKSPILVLEDTIKAMRPGSVIVDMAAANGGNCPLTECDSVVEKYNVKLIGISSYPSMVPSDASNFYANNLVNLLELLVQKKEDGTQLNYNLEDDIIQASLITFEGKIRRP